MARKATHPPIVAKSGAISKGYNFASTWEQNAPLSEQQQSAIAMLSHAVAERPFPVNLAQEHVVGQDNGLTIKTNEVFFGESEAIKAVLVNTNQFYKWFTDLESALKSETEEKYRHHVNTLTKRIQTCDDILKQTIHGDPNLRVSSLVWCRSDSAELPSGRLFSSSIDGSISEWDLFHLKQKLSDGKTMNKLLMEAEPRMTLFTGSSKVAEKLALDLKGRIKLEDLGFDWKVLGPDVHEVDYVAWTCNQDAYACSGQKCSAQSILFIHEPQL